MSKGTLEISRNFNEWMDNPENFNKVRKFFMDMREPIKDIMHFGWEIGKTWVKIGDNEKSKSGFKAILGSFEKMLNWAEEFVPLMTESFTNDLLPTLERTAEFMSNVWELTTPWINSALEGATRLTEWMNNSNWGKWLALVSMLGMFGPTRGIGKGIGGAIGGWLGQRGGTSGGVGTGGKIAKRVAGPLNAAADIQASDVHVTNTVANPVPVWVMNPGGIGGGPDIDPDGKGRSRRGRWGRAGALATILGLVAAPQVMDVPETVAPPANPVHHNNRQNVSTSPGQHGGIPSPAASMQMMMQGGGKPLENYIKNVATSTQLREMMRMNPSATVAQQIQGELGWRGNREAPFSKKTQAAQADAALTAAGLIVGGPGAASAGKGLFSLGRAALSKIGPKIATGLGAGGGALAHAAPAGAATTGAKKEMSWIERSMGRINRLVETTTARTAAKATQRSAAANRAMAANAAAAARSLLSTMGAAVQSVWQMVQGAVSGAGQMLGGLLGSGSGTPGTGSPGGYGEGAGSTGSIVGGAQLGELAGGLSSAAGSLLNQIPGVKTITAVKSDHKKFTANGNISDHWFGKAFDFVTGGQSEMKNAGKFIRANASKFGVNASQTFDPGYDPYGGHSGSNSHVHVAFKSGDGRGSTGGAKGGPTGGVSISNSAGVTVSFAGAQFVIQNDDDYDAVMEKLAEKLGQAFGANGTESTAEMTGAD
jgi:hypothetical protein